MSDTLLSFKSPTDFLKYCKDNAVQYIDFNFSDMRGAWHHTAQHIKSIDQRILERGLFFDGSSIAGWKTINNSDMILMPDLARVCIDPFAAQTTLKVFCDIYDPDTNAPYNRDPRSIAKAAEKALGKSKIGDTAYFGPEPEFFVFDDVKINVLPHKNSFEIDSEEGPYNDGRSYETGNMGHRPKTKGGYFPDAPIDQLADLRGEMLTIMDAMGVPVEKHHHEVAASQCELGISFETLTTCADNVQLYKHVVKNVAHSYGKTATFMPKPVFGDNGSGMHVHQSIWNEGKPLFAGKGYAGLSDKALYYIGGIIKHAKALNAFTNPTTNSYKRLVPGYEAPVLLAYSARNRSASCRIPYSTTDKGKRIEIRFPDPCANPYLAFAAMLMAGLDGIANKIHPGEAHNEDLYELEGEELAAIPTVAGSLEEALNALETSHDFLLAYDVFSKDMIEAYITMKRTEVDLCRTTVHPIEYHLYYSS